MKRSIRFTMWGAAVCVLSALLGAGSAQAQSGGSYDLSWTTIDGGGATMSGGSYSLDGTTGQPDAGDLVGGSYKVGGGFWGGGASTAATGVGRPGLAANRSVMLSGWPNPFSKSADFGFSVAKPEHVSLKIYDLRGGLVRTLVEEVRGPGYFQVTWDGRDGSGRRVPNAVYLVRLATATAEASTKTVYLGNR
jgi:hypothetical protein